MQRSLLVVTVLALAACAPVGPVDTDGGTDAPDAGPGSADFESCIPAVDPGPVFAETLTLQGDGVRVRIARRPGDGPTVGETFAFDLLGFALEASGSDDVTCVTDAAALDYEYGHHNWDEVATVEAGAVTWVLTLVYDVVNSVWIDTLQRQEGGVDVGEAIELSLLDCESRGPSPANGCFQRAP